MSHHGLASPAALFHKKVITSHSLEPSPVPQIFLLLGSGGCFVTSCHSKADKFLGEVKDLLVLSCGTCFDLHKKMLSESKKPGASKELIPCHICYGLNRCEGHYLCEGGFKICKACKHRQENICTAGTEDEDLLVVSAGSESTPLAVAEKHRRSLWESVLRTIVDWQPNQFADKQVIRSKSVKIAAHVSASGTATVRSFDCACGEVFPSSQQKANHCKRCEVHINTMTAVAEKSKRPPPALLERRQPKKSRSMSDIDEEPASRSVSSKGVAISNEELMAELRSIKSLLQRLLPSSSDSLHSSSPASTAALHTLQT